MLFGLCRVCRPCQNNFCWSIQPVPDRLCHLVRAIPMPESNTLPETNPLREALPRTRVSDPCAVVLFGATGDLAHRKLVPALFQLARGGNLPSECADRRLRPPRLDRRRPPRRVREDAEQRAAGPTSARSGRSSPTGSSSRPGTFDDPASYQKLKETLDRVDQTLGTRGNRVYYLAVAPEFFATIIKQLGRGGPDLSLAAGEPLEPGGHREAVRPRPQERPCA